MSHQSGSIRFAVIVACVAVVAWMSAELRAEPVRVIFDTDIGNDIDDALALAMLHAYADEGKVELLGVTISKDNPLCAPFVDAVNTFYGRRDVPIGVVRDGQTPEDEKYLRPVIERKLDGKLAYPHDLKHGGDALDAVALQRRLLAAQPDRTVTFVVVGFSTNIARLLGSTADDHSALSGRELVARKVRLLSIMAGMYGENRRKEYNVYIDADAARKVYRDWPTPIVASGFEIGDRIRYPAASIERDFNYVPLHPIAEAYRHYDQMPYDRPCWDLTSVLYAVEPDAAYFDLSPPGTITVDAGALTECAPHRGGKHRYLRVTAEQADRVRQRLVELVSRPPSSAPDAK